MATYQVFELQLFIGYENQWIPSFLPAREAFSRSFPPLRFVARTIGLLPAAGRRSP